MKKIVIVAYSHGREGTSALMGILKNFFYDVPDKVKPSKMNPKGFFEDPQFDQLVFECYSRNNGDLSLPPDKDIDSYLKDKDHLKKIITAFERLVDSKEKFALKAPRYLLIPLLKEYGDQYDIKILHISRNEKDHVNSIYRVWQTITGISEEKKKMKKREIRNWIKQWKKFGESILKETPFPILYVPFEEIISEREQSLKKIAAFLNETSISIDIFDWLDPKLINRKKLKL